MPGQEQYVSSRREPEKPKPANNKSSKQYGKRHGHKDGPKDGNKVAPKESYKGRGKTNFKAADGENGGSSGQLGPLINFDEPNS